MTITDYKKAIHTNGFREHPKAISSGMTALASFVNYSEADLELKIYLARMLLYRNFSATGNGEFLSDHTWFIQQFFISEHEDIPKPWLTKPIRDSIGMILSGDVFSGGIIGTTFMFGVIEYYAKHFLGWRPMEADFFDDEFHKKYRTMTIERAVNKLKKSDTPIGKSLNFIDGKCSVRLRERAIEAERWIKPKIADRLKLARNAMLHGESHSFYSMGNYLCMIYILFYLHDLKTKA